MMSSHFTIGIKFIRWTGPRPFRHGYYMQLAMAAGNTPVSIGPRLFSHGYVGKWKVSKIRKVKFQLGHVLSDMDTEIIVLLR